MLPLEVEIDTPHLLGYCCIDQIEQYSVPSTVERKPVPTRLLDNLVLGFMSGTVTGLEAGISHQIDYRR
ncbi:hypothetical protein HALLA_04075 (plasmid) [Halostagnicola larsenii XH-48]|uniref:Uncharacterized protein n=1 Tax=Halostagnicola larsenii XH-48 TaxID=797299 RepID=W0JW75_9EURY|nr:hypothetical protein HALLA_04075 [Halostagnicola larsenii XH-48]